MSCASASASEQMAPRQSGAGVAQRGVAKSGRVCKPIGDRHSSLRRDKAFHSSWQQKQKKRSAKDVISKIEKEIVDSRKARALGKRERQDEREKRRKENARKAEIVQVVRNVHKLKRMKKKQLRKIETRAVDH